MSTQAIPRGAAIFLVCVDSVEQKDLAGRLISPFFPKIQEFGGCVQLLQILSRYFTEIGYPQAFYQLRSFRKPPRQAAETPPTKEVQQYMQEDILTQNSGQKATFTVQVQFRQNATWQGTITWNEERKTQKFRSTMEMLHLMDEVLTDGEGPTWE